MPRLNVTVVTLFAVLLALAPSSSARALGGEAPVAVWRMNCGGGAEDAPTGPGFIADQPYAPGGGGYVGGTTFTYKFNVGGGMNVYDTDIHRRVRNGWTAYRFDVAPGDYIVRLHFAETKVDGPGLRTFDVSLEGAVELPALDLFARTGMKAYAFIHTTTVTVTDGTLDIEASSTTSTISAIEVWTLPAALDPPAGIVAFNAKFSYGRNIVYWEFPVDPALAGYRVYRATSAAGPFQLVAQTPTAPARYLDDQAFVGFPYFYRVAAVDVLGQEGPPTVTKSATARDASTSSLPVYELVIAPEDLDFLNANITTNHTQKVPAVFLYDGVDYEAEVRYRGQSSLGTPKKSWEVEFTREHPFEGREEIDLKSHFADATMLDQPVATWVMGVARTPIADSQLVHLRINGVYRGVYERLENVDEDFLAARDMNVGANVYKTVDDANFIVHTSLGKYQTSFPKKTNKNGSWDDLIDLVEFVNDEPDATFINAFTDVFDVDSFLNYMAGITWLADIEGTHRNLHLVHDLDLDRWDVVPWDNDIVFDYPYTPVNMMANPDNWVTDSALSARLMSDLRMRRRFIDKIEALMAGPLAEGPTGAYAQRVDALFASMEDDGIADVEKRGWEVDNNFLAGPADVKGWAAFRESQLGNSIAWYKPAAPATDIWINELMASNQTVVQDEEGRPEDWIELYNATGAPLDVGGLYLTNDLGDPTRWPIPAGTTIDAFGHLVIWADGDLDDGPLHAGFQLDAEFGELGLFAADGATLLDFYHYKPPQFIDVSWGRETDAGPFFGVLGTPTPGAPNVLAGNVPPWITWVELDPPVPTAFTTVTVTCRVTDADGLQSVRLERRVGAGPLVSVPMTPLDADRYTASIPGAPAGTLVQYSIRAVDALGRAVSDPVGTPPAVHTYTVFAPLAGGVRINEVLADNESVVQDDAGDFADYVELVNQTGALLDVGGMYLTDDLGNPDKWQIPAGTMIPPFGELVIWTDDEPEQGPLHASFALSKGGEHVGLFATDGATLVDGFTFGAQQEDVSIGLMPDASSVLVSLLDPSPGAANVPAPGEHVRYDDGNVEAFGVTLVPLAPAEVGGTALYSVTGAPPFAVGLAPVWLTTLQLHAGVKGTLLVDPTIVMLPFPIDARGAGTIVIGLPAEPLLAGVTLYIQAYASGAGFTNAVATTVAP